MATDKQIIESLSSAICSCLSLVALRGISRDTSFTVRSRVSDGGVLLLFGIGVVGMNNDWSESMVIHQCSHDASIASRKHRLSREDVSDHLARPGLEAACERIHACLCKAAGLGRIGDGFKVADILKDRLGLSMMKVQKYCNGIIGEIIRILLRGGKGLAKAIRGWKQDYADCAKEKPGFINRLRGKAVSRITAILLRPSFTAEVHIPSPEDNPPPLKPRRRGRRPAAAAKAQA